MYNLITTTMKIQVVLGGAVTTNQLVCTAHGGLHTLTGITLTEYDVSTNNTTPVDLVPAPGADERAITSAMTVYNADTVDADVTILLNNNGTLRIIAHAVLATGEMLSYEHGGDWQLRTAAGDVRVVTGAASDATFITQLPHASLTNEQALSALATGLMKVTTATGVVTSIAGTVQYQVLTTGASPFAPAYSAFLLDGTAGGKTVFAVTNAKTLTLTAVDTYNLTIPATGTAALTGLTLAQFAATTSAQLAGVLSDETGTDKAVFNTSPTLITPALGTPSALVGTNITGTAAGLTAGNVSTNANLTGPITSIGNATSIAAQTGTGTTFAMSVSPVFTTQITTPSIISAAAMGITPAAGSNLNITISGAGLLAVNTDELVVDPGVGVGVGTAGPVSALHVNGNITLDVGGNKYYFAKSGVAPDTNWSLGNEGSPTGAQIVTTSGIVQQIYNGATYGYMIRNTSNTSLFEVQGSGGKVYIAGNVGLATAIPLRILGIGGLAARNIGMERGTVADTAGFALTLNAGAATAASTDKAGGYIDIKGGLSTGNAETGVRLYGNTAGASGTADSAYYLMHHILGNKQAWFNTAPAVKQTGYAVPTDLASCIAALTAWRTAAINYGLMTTV